MVKKSVCRLLLTTDLSNREIAERCHLSHNTVGRYRERLKDEGLSWAQIADLSELQIDARLNNRREKAKQRFIEPDWAYVHAELHRAGVTLTLLYEEYASGIEAGQMSDREFRRRYDRYKRSLGLVMRQVRRPGEELFVDYSGKRPSITNPATGVRQPVELWVGVLGAGRKTFAVCTMTQQIPDWIDAHVRALEYFGACPKYFVPDNLKSAVVRISRKDGHYINPTYQGFADHYDVMVLPTRARKPKDKASVEAAVRLAQMWILAKLRNRTFFSIDELNRAVRELLEPLNSKPMRTRGGKSRNQLFEELDLPAMRPLPVQAYEFAEWKIDVPVPNDYHVAVDGNYYSVPHTLVARKVNLKICARVIEIYHHQQRVATHERANTPDSVRTKTEHQPPAHRLYGEEQLAELVSWSEAAGESVSAFVRQHLQLHSGAASLQVFRGLKSLSRDFGTERLDQACSRALRVRATSISSVRSMLARGIENSPLQNEAANDPPPAHENVRGAASYE